MITLNQLESIKIYGRHLSDFLTLDQRDILLREINLLTPAQPAPDSGWISVEERLPETQKGKQNYKELSQEISELKAWPSEQEIDAQAKTWVKTSDDYITMVVFRSAIRWLQNWQNKNK